MSHPFVSVVVPTRNRDELLRDCLKSLLAQDYPHDRYQVIVVDDGSGDSTRTVVGSFADNDIVMLYSRTRLPRGNGSGGPNVARNVGIRMGRGGLVAFLDDDVICPPLWLSRIVAESQGAAELVYGPVALSPGVRLPTKHGEELVYLSIVPTPSIPLFCNMLVRRNLFDRGYPSEQWFPPAEETEWIRRIQPIMRFAPEAAVIHQKTPEDVRINRLVRTAWFRGRESGRFARRVDGNRADEVIRASISSARALGHAVITRCWGGLLVAVGRAAFVYGWLRG